MCPAGSQVFFALLNTASHLGGQHHIIESCPKREAVLARLEPVLCVSLPCGVDFGTYRLSQYGGELSRNEYRKSKRGSGKSFALLASNRNRAK